MDKQQKWWSFPRTAHCSGSSWSAGCLALPPRGIRGMPQGIICCELLDDLDTTSQYAIFLPLMYSSLLIISPCKRVGSYKAYSCKPSGEELYWETSNSKTEKGFHFPMNLHPAQPSLLVSLTKCILEAFLGEDNDVWAESSRRIVHNIHLCCT